MLSKIKTKFIASLRYKKYRDLHNAYIIEGEKIILELLQQDTHKINILLTTDAWAKTLDKNLITKAYEHILISNIELKKLSSLKSPSKGIAVVNPPNITQDRTDILNSLSLVLDTIQDPGNLGTIIRIANWFGIDRIFCSDNSVDLYNPKVIQASMGAILRTRVFYTDLRTLFSEYQQPGFPIYGTLLNGTSIYKSEILQKGFIIFGNESKGISAELLPFINNKISIPNYPADRKSTESLNVSIAAAIVCAEFRRRTYSAYSK
ncbi:MAG: RNA methyltransferase [Bacteroidales bacterium]|nr:RNA methyltransferase [Bacteroidales bacterium]